MKRHISMTISSILSISIALLMGMSMVVLALNVDSMTNTVESQLQLQVSLMPGTSEEQKNSLEEQMAAMDGIVSIRYSSKEEELEELIEENGEMFSRYESSNPLYDVFLVEIDPLTEMDSVSQQLSDLPNVVEVSYGGSAITKLVSIFTAVRKAGYLIAAGLMILGVFLIRNTIRLTIQVREDEIAIMRTVGAYNFYITGPFMLEGLFMGFWAALLPAVLISVTYVWLYQALDGVLISNLLALYPPFPMLINLVIGDFAVGLTLGAFGSFLATYKTIRRAR